MKGKGSAPAPRGARNVDIPAASILVISAALVWCGGGVGRASDLRFTGDEFESSLGTIAEWPCASYLHLCPSVTKQYNLVPAKAGE